MGYFEALVGSVPELVSLGSWFVADDLTGTLPLDRIACTLMWCQVVFWPKLCIAWMQQTHHFSFWGKTWPQRMSSCLSRWQYTCIHQWRELAFHPDQNEPNQVVIVPSISKLGKEVSWTFLFHLTGSLRCIGGLVRTTFCVFSKMFYHVLVCM